MPFPCLNNTQWRWKNLWQKKNSDNEGTKSTRAPPVMYGIVLEAIILQPGGEQCLQLDQVY